jgi:WD40 repeat protein
LSRGIEVHIEGDSKIEVWNTQTEQMVRQLGTVEGCIHSIDVSADGKLLAIGESAHRVHVWEIETGRSILLLKNADTSPEEDKEADLKEEKYDKTDSRHVSAVAFSPDSKLLAASGQDGMIRLWRIPSGERLLTLARNEPFRRQWAEGGMSMLKLSEMRVGLLQFDREGKRLFAFRGGAAGLIDVWNTQTGELIETVEFPDGGRPGDFSSDSELFAWATPDGKINIYETNTFSLIGQLAGHKGKVTSLSFSNDVKYQRFKETMLSSASDDGTISLWRLR